jgi:hypothetical protein
LASKGDVSVVSLTYSLPSVMLSTLSYAAIDNKYLNGIEKVETKYI